MSTQTKRNITDEYYIMLDGNGMEHKYINLDNPNICPRKGIVELEALKKKDHQLILKNQVSISIFNDRDTGIIWAIPIGIDQTSKQIRHKRIVLGPNTFFDRSVKDQAEMCAIMLKCLENGVPSTSNGRPQFKVRDKEKQARIEMDNRSMRRKALDIAEGLGYDEELRGIATNLGIITQGTSYLVLHNKVCSYAETNPKEFLDMYNDPNREYVLILNKAKEMGIVEHDITLGWKFNGLILGQTQSMAANELRKKPDLAQSISTITNERKAVTPTFEPAKVKAEEVFKPNDETAELKRQLAEMKAAMEAMMKSNSEKLSTGAEEASEEDEMKALRKEANELKIMGANAPKVKKETLIAKIAEAKAKLAEA